ncbi:MAG: IPT/TIG domain-containing protein [Candidatus Eremiobacteraeota bacterium]|nr:IPT/TIG domain-containing protein [Candidatus Eremiobacteraeota bacterium]
MKKWNVPLASGFTAQLAIFMLCLYMASLLAGGCGGGGGGSSSGGGGFWGGGARTAKMEITVPFPKKGTEGIVKLQGGIPGGKEAILMREIPAGTTYFAIYIYERGTTENAVPPVRIDKPATGDTATATINGVPIGWKTIRILASNASNEALAESTFDVDVVAGDNPEVTMVLTPTMSPLVSPSIMPTPTLSPSPSPTPSPSESPQPSPSPTSSPGGGGGGGGTSYTPSLSNVSPTTIAPGDFITVTGSNFGATRGTLIPKSSSSYVLFEKISDGSFISAFAYASWSDTQIVCASPSLVDGESYCVSVNRVVGGVTYTSSCLVISCSAVAPLPSIATVTDPASAGGAITISGANFGATQGQGYVGLISGSNQSISATVNSWATGTIIVIVPSNFTSGSMDVFVHVAGRGNSSTYTVTLNTDPIINYASKIPLRNGIQILIAGSNFGAAQGTGSATISGSGTLTVNSWSNTQILATPSGLTVNTNESITVTTDGGLTSLAFPVHVDNTTTDPTITTTRPLSTLIPGEPLLINGTNFGAVQGAGTAKVQGYNLTGISWGASNITGNVPSSGFAAGEAVVVQVTDNSGLKANTMPFSIYNPATDPKITSAPQSILSSSTGPLTLTGTNFGTISGSIFILDGTTAVVTPCTVSAWNDTSVTFTLNSSIGFTGTFYIWFITDGGKEAIQTLTSI